MPELPEVRTVAFSLKKQLLNKKITGIKIIYPKMIEVNSLDFKLLINQTIKDINTVGKYLIFELTDYYLISHLRMEGKYFIKGVDDPIIKHEHIIFELSDLSLRYHDTRKFGRMSLIRKDELSDYLHKKKLSLEPFDNKMTPEYLLDKLKNKNIEIKSLLLNQSIILGLGNIYVDEVLFASGISPLKVGKSITHMDAENIITNSKEILTKAIKYGGTTIRSYTSSLGVTGHYQDHLLVHKRENELCYQCHNPIKKIKVGGRSTYYCETCQKDNTLIK